MGRIRAALLALVCGLAGLPAVADRLVVVELFTSQGCSSCPPADALLGELATRADVLPLAFHVDYWDYIGWKDIFGDPANTERQRRYAAAAGARTVYTPQMVVGGKDHVVGYKPMKLAMLIDRHGEAEQPVAIEAVRAGGEVRIALEPMDRPVGAVEVLLVRYLPERTVDIRRGENAGRTLDYHNIVVSLRSVGRWSGQGRFAKSVPADGEGEFAVLVQRQETGPILAAGRVR